MKRLTLLVILACVEFAWGQKTTQIMVKHEEYEGSVEICENCQDIKPNASKIYAYFDNGELNVASEGTFKGKLLHGKANLKYKEEATPYLQAEFIKGERHGLYKEWMPDGTLLKEENFANGIKNGKSIHYLFGKLETEEVYNNGNLISVIYFSADNEKPERKVEYLQDNGATKKAKSSYISTNGNVLEAEQIELWEGKEIKTTYYDGSYKKIANNQVKEQGTYSKNERIGEWKQFFSDGVIITRKYDKGLPITETFTKDGQNFTGTAIDKNSLGRVIAQYAIKNGLRNGQSIDSVGKKGVVINYQNGKASLEELNFEDFYKKNVTKAQEFKLKKQCDGRGKGLYVDKIEITDKHTIVYCNYVSQLKGNSSIYTPKVGSNDAFTMQITDSKEIKPLLKHFYLLNDDKPISMWYGEMFSFVLVFDKISPNVKNINFIEGAEAYATNSDGTYIYNWGCYEIELK